MKSMQHTTLMLALAGALSLPIMSMAADAAMDGHSSHHSGQPQAAAEAASAPDATGNRMQAMRARMMEIRASKDPEKREQLMEALIKDMEATMQDGSCPMMAAGKGDMGMMGGQGGMGMMGHGMHGGMPMGQGMTGPHDMMSKRMEMLEKRMDMMQMMQMRMGPGMQGGGLGTPDK